MTQLEQDYKERNELLKEIKRLKIENDALKYMAKKERRYINYKQVINKITDAIYFFKVEEGRSGHFIEVNECAHARLGYTREEILNMSPLEIDIMSEEQIMLVYEKISKRKQISFESYHVCKDGTHLPVEIKLHKIDIRNEEYIVAVCRDISDRKESEKVINNAKEQYEKLVESSTNGVAVVQDGIIVFTNQTLVKMLGVTCKEALLEKSLIQFLDSSSQQDYSLLTKQGQTHEKLSCTWKKLDGSDLYTEVITIPTNFDEKPSNQLIIQDVSERKQNEQMMLQAEKMNVVGQLAAGIAHEIRNPLTSLKGFVQLFRSDSVPNELFLSIMESELERINVISNEFLTLAKPYNLDFFPVDLKMTLSSVISLLETEAFKQSVTIISQIKSDDLVVNGISTELKQVLINLMKNAIEATLDGGNLYIQAEKREDFIEITIKDEGIGMTTDQLKRLGEPFYTTKELGTGLGLMVTYKIIQNHFGKIKVQSKRNEGTIVTVKLPAAE
ncbi:PAS domain S-box protein [Pullulanibacillus sp. KACC 23026]|uniref:PAS domain S-box protein n=1 Tax=Pullulanibacillus sp. KACC 23026 TaxID=3028315 RepID=UPI0023AF2E64|nr:PAS domain S-box protein [Pullulanibacillus sp. KACC 23026]WEG14597.1 PAS domain S-box protein [Pullulanibacillus sp. KACC 23026]